LSVASSGPGARRRGLAVALALAAAAFGLYAAGACRTIYVGDSGELVAAVHTLGIPHPSGYPLYVLLGKLWTLLVPVGSVAYRMSLFSACCAALAVALLYLGCRALPVGRTAALAAAILFAGSPSFWGEANVQRVYALSALFVALLSWLALRWLAERAAVDPPAGDPPAADRSFVAVAFVCGLGAANHPFVAVWGACFLACAAVADPALLRRFWTLLGAAGAALAGLSVYAFLPLRSRQEPRLDWGDPETFDRFLAVVTRRDFWDRAWVTGRGDLATVAGDFLASFAGELTLAGAALAVVGLVVGLRRRPALLLPAVVALANVAVMALHGSRSDLFLWHRYYVPAYLSAALLVAVGLDAALAAARRWRPLAAATAVVAVGGALALVAVRYPQLDRSRYRIAEDYSRTLLASLPPGAQLAASDDNILFVLIYLQLVEGVRADVHLILQGVGGALPPLRFDPDREPLFFTHHPNWRLPALAVVPVGLVYQVVRAGASPPPPLPGVAAKESLAGEDDPRVPKDYLTRNLIGEYHFMRGVTWEAGDRARSLRELARAARAAPDNDVLFYNLGLVYARMGRDTDALAAFERSAAINPRALPGPRHARAADRIAELRRRLRR
jgi:tetratricopeptide (TPR) repeat protein